VKNTVAKLWGGEDIDKSLEISMKDVEARLASAAEAEEAAHTEGHRETEDARPLRVPLKPRAEAPLKPQTRSLLQAPKKKDGFEKSDARGMALTSTSYNNLSAVGQLQNKLAGTLARPERPPDAFALLRQARDQGVLFQEDSQRDGHSEDQDDPELAPGATSSASPSSWWWPWPASPRPRSRACRSRCTASRPSWPCRSTCSRSSASADLDSPSPQKS
jgi:hypothetical protein